LHLYLVVEQEREALFKAQLLQQSVANCLVNEKLNAKTASTPGMKAGDKKLSFYERRTLL
jgi:hypothetical protein